MDRESSSSSSSSSSAAASSTESKRRKNEMDQRIIETVDGLRSTLAPKRECRIHLVVLSVPPPSAAKRRGSVNDLGHEVDDGNDDEEDEMQRLSAVTVTAGDATATVSIGGGGETERRLAAIRAGCRLAPSAVTVLNVPDDVRLERTVAMGDGSDAAATTAEAEATEPSPTLRKLHRTLRDASASYYLHLARRSKRKLSNLGDAVARDPSRRLPYAIRYGIKIGTYYDLQGRDDKGSRYLRDAYGAVEALQRHLVQRKEALNKSSGSAGDAADGGRRGTVSSAIHAAPSSPGDDGEGAEGVELSLDVVAPRQPPFSSGGADVPSSPSSALPPPPPTSAPVPTTTTTTTQGHQPQQLSSFHPGFGGGGGGTIAALPPPKPETPTEYGLVEIEDMLHQCRAIAGWLNLRLVRAAFAAAANAPTTTEGKVAAEGLNTAAAQWRRHRQVFLSPSRSYGGNDDGGDDDKRGGITAPPAWHRWSDVAHQGAAVARLAAAAAAARATTLGLAAERTGPFGEVLLSCEAWRLYASVAESALRLGCEVAAEVERRRERAAAAANETKRGRPASEKEEESSAASASAAKPSDAQRFVGGLDSEGLEPRFRFEAGRDHKALALDYAIMAICLYNQENEGKDESSVVIYQPRSCSRLHYLAGGILMGMERYREAADHLRKASVHTSKWPSMDVPIRKMLAKCMKKFALDESGESKEDIHRDPSVPLFFNRETSALMSPAELEVACADAFSSNRDVAWPEDLSAFAPFDFAVTFPDKTHATAGDTVPATLSLVSHLKFPVRIKSITLLTTAGQFDVSPVPTEAKPLKTTDSNLSWPPSSSEDFFCAPSSLAFFSSDIALPSDMSILSSTKTGDAPTGKSSVKSAKIHNSGFTRAGGSISSTISPDELATYRQAKRSNRGATGALDATKKLFGGTPVSCHGVVLGLANGLNLTQNTVLSLALSNKKHDLPVGLKSPPKRPQLEEENYVTQAWARPPFHPLSLGPSCLRVHGPIPQMEVEDVTALHTHGKVMEGTVNRLLLKLRAGPKEYCHDLKMSVACSTTFDVTTSGTNQSSASDVEGDSNIPGAETRLPMLVVPDTSSGENYVTEDGYKLPPGWKPRGETTGQGSLEELLPVSSRLDPGKCTCVEVNLFRPLQNSPLMAYQADGTCTTSFDVAITYRQRRQDSASDAVQHKTNIGDLVTQNFSSSVTWCLPISAEFSVLGGANKAFPSGSRHPINLVSKANVSALKSSSVGSETFSSGLSGESTSEAPVIDGESINVQCSLEAKEAEHGLAAEIQKISFEASNADEEGDGSECDFILNAGEGSKESPATLYTPKGENDICRLLREGFAFGLHYSVHAKLKAPPAAGFGADEEIRRISSSLGVISIDWRPLSLPVPQELENTIESNSDGGVFDSAVHGPLRLSTPSRIKFYGPSVEIENAPFEAALSEFPSSPKVAVPFEVAYRITNKTPVYQQLTVSMSEASDGASEGVLVSGMVKGELRLSPFETRSLAYTVLATRAGKTPMPALTVSSVRHESWVINDGPSNPRYFFVLP